MLFRHQCILDTLSALQAYFLRAYGAFVPDMDTDTGAPPPSTATGSRPLQCRRMYENSPACDAFHLGEMIRFFTARSKTLRLETALPTLTLTFDSDDENDDDSGSGEGGGSEDGHDGSSRTDRDRGLSTTTTTTTPTPHAPQQQQHSTALMFPETNILDLLAALRQCPERQIDANHAGCGIRRQLIPALDAVERCVGGRAVGVCLDHYARPAPASSALGVKGDANGAGTAGGGSWDDPAFRRDVEVAVVGGHVNVGYGVGLGLGSGVGTSTGVRHGHGHGHGQWNGQAQGQWRRQRQQQQVVCRCTPQVETARALFTAERRSWDR